MSKKKKSMTLAKMVRQTLFRTIETCVGTTAMGFYSKREIGLSSEYSMSKWMFFVFVFFNSFIGV